MAQQQKDPHARKHWDGPHWGPQGAVQEGLFKLLVTLYTAVKSAPSRKHRYLAYLGIVILFWVIRLGYEAEELNPDQIDVLASVASKLPWSSNFAIRTREYALTRDPSPTTRMLLLKGLMVDEEMLQPLKKGGIMGGRYFGMLREEFREVDYDPPEQKVRILRALAWWYVRNGSEAEIKRTVAEAVTVATKLGADDQLFAITQEFWQYM